MAAIRCKTCQMFAPVNEQTPPGITERFYWHPESPNMVQALMYTAEIRIVNVCDICKNELSEHVFNIELDFSTAVNHKCPNAQIGLGWTCRLTSCYREVKMYPPDKKVQVKLHFIHYTGILRCGCDEVRFTFAGSRNIKTSDMTQVM